MGASAAPLGASDLGGTLMNDRSVELPGKHRQNMRRSDAAAHQRLGCRGVNATLYADASAEASNAPPRRLWQEAFNALAASSSVTA
jgi:hypothetical protein